MPRLGTETRARRAKGERARERKGEQSNIIYIQSKKLFIGWTWRLEYGAIQGGDREREEERRVTSQWEERTKDVEKRRRGRERRRGERTSLELVLLLDGVRVGRSLGGVDKLISEAMDPRRRRGRSRYGSRREWTRPFSEGRAEAGLTTRRWT